MSTIKISKIKARRGTDTQRKQVIFDQGELIYTTDTQRFYVGDGVTVGGTIIGMKAHNALLDYSSLSSQVSEVGDIINVGNSYYQLTASDYSNTSSWAILRLPVDPIFFNYNSTNHLTILTDSISAAYLDSSTVLSGVKIQNGILQSDINTKSLEISANQISLKLGGINEREISSTSFGNGISGGSNTKIALNVDTNKFQFDSGVLKLSSLPTTYGGGLVYDPTTATLSASITSAGGGLVTTLSGQVQIANDGADATVEWPKVTVDAYGRVLECVSSIFGTLTGQSLSGSHNTTNTLSAIFNGSPTGTYTGANLTFFTALSSNGASTEVITLSSAGFITFEGNTTSRTGQSIGRFAIPIFSY